MAREATNGGMGVGGVVAMVLASAQRLGVSKLGMVGNEQFGP